MKVWVVTTKKKKKVVGVFSSKAYADKTIQDPENVEITPFIVNLENPREYPSL